LVAGHTQARGSPRGGKRGKKEYGTLASLSVARKNIANVLQTKKPIPPMPTGGGEKKFNTITRNHRRKNSSNRKLSA